MKVAFYAPLKPADHPVPSGDRQIARALLQALRAGGHETFVASRFRSFDRAGDRLRQARLRETGGRLAQRLIVRYRNAIARPDVWFTYHVYHKAPDWLGPAVSRALDIPYVIAEASFAAKQRDGAWAIGYQGSAAAIEAAAATISLNPVDRAGICRLRGAGDADVFVPPFLDLAAFTRSTETTVAGVAKRDACIRLITVAMMRPGAKLASYRLLATALARIRSIDWELVIVGDGPARPEVEAAFASFPTERVRLVGFQTSSSVAAWLRAGDVYVWPAIDEAFGMAFIEAQACGLPVVAGEGGGVGAVVCSGRTGLLVPVGDAEAFATATGRLLTDAQLRRRMAEAAPVYARAEHDLPVAAARIDAVLRGVTERGALRAGADAIPPTAR
jgi:glycosyltransferase involved in cell wall biosynthesis